MCVKNASNDERRPDRAAASTTLEIGSERLRELRVLHVLQHDALRALFAHDPLVVRQVERRGLHGAVAVAGGVDLVDHDDRRQRAELRVALLRIDRQVVLDVLQLAGEPLQLRGLRLVAHRDVGLERGLVVEELVLVDLVRPDGRLDARLSAPSTRRRCRSSRSRETRRRACVRNALERRLGRQLRRLAQQRGRPRELALILDVVGHDA